MFQNTRKLLIKNTFSVETSIPVSDGGGKKSSTLNKKLENI